MKEKIKKGIEEFNKLRAPETNAKLISFKNKILEVKFSGPFCLSCGVNDYFEDLKIFLEEQDVKAEIISIDEIEDGFLVKFKVV
ncbi:MAG: hypothetical protein QXP77_01645 [Candidatus Aenigmatarchaeota archaeon]